MRFPSLFRERPPQAYPLAQPDVLFRVSRDARHISSPPGNNDTVSPAVVPSPFPRNPAGLRLPGLRKNQKH